MSTITTQCQACDRSFLRCTECRRSFCDYYREEHQHDLSEQSHDVTSVYSNLKQIITLPTSYGSLIESTELLNTIDQWEMETIRQRENSLLRTVRIRMTSINWTQYQELVIKQPNRRGNEEDIRFDRLSFGPPRIVLDILI